MEGEDRGGGQARPRPEAVPAADVAWVLLLPAAAISAAAIVLFAPIGGRLLLRDPHYDYWTGPGTRKAAVHVGYALFVVCAVAYAGAIVRFAGMRMARAARRGLVVAAQLATVAFLLACLVFQRHVVVAGTRNAYFTPATLTVAALATLAVAAFARLRGGGAAASARLMPPGWAHRRAVRVACLAAAALAIVVFVLPAVHTDDATPSGQAYLGSLFYDEANAVLNGRSTFVEMVAYGNLWPYVTLVPLHAFGDTYATFTVAMAALTALALLAVWGVLRRVVREAPLALALFLPVLATGFFLERRTNGDRYDPGTYFGMFPLRYAGPYLLAWLTAWQLGRDPDERWTRRLLFAAAGLVALNNVDFGGAALAATVLACVVHCWPRDRRASGALMLDVAIGLAGALGAVSALTLAREGSLPQLGLLVRYGRVFVDGGVANSRLPVLGMHLVVSATFVAAGAVAAVRASRSRGGELLAAMLAWCALFGLGASVYFYAYRSLPDVLVNLFSIWSLTLALLVAAALRAASPPGRRVPSLPVLALTFAFALAACSLAQAPSPVQQLRRIGGSTPSVPGSVPAGAFRAAAAIRIVAARTRPGEVVAIVSPLGHRIAHGAGVVNVCPYTGWEQMPAREQLAETVELLRREGGTKLYVAQAPTFGLEAELTRLGFVLAGRWRAESWPEPTISEYRAA
jgi:hypothetical protein